jgi:drug/metabolite transporter (DMT)-like permease
MADTLHTTVHGAFWAGAAILIWSGSLVMLRLGVTTELNAYDLTCLRLGVAALVLAPFVIRRGKGAVRPGFKTIVLMVLTFGAPYVLLIAVALETAPAAAAGFLNPAVMAIGAVILGLLVSKDRARPAKLLGLIVTALGLAVYLWSGGGMVQGHFILFATGGMWALYALVVRRSGVSALQATAMVAIGSMAVYLPLYLLFLPKAIGSAPLLDVLAQGGFHGVLVSVGAVYAFNRSAELLGPVAGAALPALIPIVTLLMGALALGEVFQLGELVAALVVALGLCLILVGASPSRAVALTLGPEPEPGNEASAPARASKELAQRQ